MLIFMYILCTCVVARNGCRVLRTTTPIPLESISFQRGVTFLCQMLEICRRCLAVSRCSSADLVCSIATLPFCSVVVSSHHANLYLSFISKLRFYMRYLWRTLRLCSFVSTRSTIGSRHVILCLKCCLSTACLIHSLRLSASSSSKVCIVTKRENCTLLLFFFTDERSTFLLSCSICDFFLYDYVLRVYSSYCGQGVCENKNTIFTSS